MARNAFLLTALSCYLVIMLVAFFVRGNFEEVGIPRRGRLASYARKQFSPDVRSYLKGFTRIPHFKSTSTFSADEVVFVMYATEKTFEQTRSAIMDLRKLFDGRIVLYDLGLTIKQINDIVTVCNLEHHVFDFGSYPKHVQSLRNYSFRPLIMMEAYRRFPVFWLMDPTIRFRSKKVVNRLYRNYLETRTTSFMMDLPIGLTVLSTTDRKMYDYFPIEVSQTWRRAFDASAMFVVRSKFSMDIIHRVAQCALTEECIAPSKLSSSCDNTRSTKSTHDCHRYDSSAYNIAIYSVLRRERRNYSTRDFRPILEKTNSTYSGPLPQEC